MAFSALFFTGFEDGNGMSRWPLSSGSAAANATAHTGAYSLYFSNAATYWVPLPTAQSDLYLTVWFYQINSGGLDLRFYTGSDYVRVWLNSGYISVSRNTTTLATGTAPISLTTWYNLQVRVVIGNSGSVRVLIDGNEDINFSGDTMQNAETTITNVRFACTNTGTKYHIDDLAFGTGGYPGDIRVDILKPNADTATEQWSRSTGSDSYALVDEVPMSATDYLYTTTSGYKTILDLENFTGTNKTPVGVSMVVCAKKDNANADQIKIGLVVGGTEYTALRALTTSDAYYNKIDLTNPAGGNWDDTALDGLQVIIEAVIA